MPESRPDSASASPNDPAGLDRLYAPPQGSARPGGISTSAGPTPSTKWTVPEILILGILVMVQFVAIVDFMVIMPLGPRLATSIGLTTWRFSCVVAAYTYAAGLTGIFSTLILDRYARRPVFLTLFAGFIVGTLLCGLAPDFWSLLAARALTGAFGGLLGGMSMTIIGDVFPENRRGTATGALMTGFAMASTFGVPIGLFLAKGYGWHAPFLALVALCVPFFGLAAAVLPRMDGHLARYQFGQSAWDRLRATFFAANHLRAFALTVALMLGGFSVIPYIPNYLVHNVGVAEADLFWTYVAGGLTALVGMPIIGRLSDHFGKLRVFCLLIPLNAALLLLATCLPPLPLGVVLAVFALMMLFNGGRMVPAMAMITSSVEPRMRGGFMAANSAVQHFAAGLGASLGGLIITQPKANGPIGHYPIVGLCAVVVTLATPWIAGRLRPAATAPVSPATPPDATTPPLAGSASRPARDLVEGAAHA